MKKLFAIVLFCSFVLWVVSPTIEIYASEQTVLNQAIDTGIATIEKLWEIANKKLETIQSKEADTSQKERIDEKQQEIEAYVNEVQKKLDSDIDSKQELNTTLVEAQKVIALKAVSGITEYQEVSSNIPATIAKDTKSLSSAVEVMQNTFTTKNKYSLVISTTYSKEKIQTLLLRLSFCTKQRKVKMCMNFLSLRRVSSEKKCFQISKRGIFQKVFYE